jgi:hypothetical protein
LKVLHDATRFDRAALVREGGLMADLGLHQAHPDRADLDPLLVQPTADRPPVATRDGDSRRTPPGTTSSAGRRAHHDVLRRRPALRELWLDRRACEQMADIHHHYRRESGR